MFKSLPQKLSRKRLNSKANSSYNDLVALRNLQSTTEGYAHRSASCISPDTANGGPEDVSISAAGFHALEPQADQHVLQANSQHTFAAVFTQARSARGGLYLRQHLYMELQAQISKKKGNLPAALHAALDILNDDYLNLNPSSRHILEGVEMAVAYWDIKTGLLYVLSNGNCRCIIGKRVRGGEGIQVVADIGRHTSKEAKDVLSVSEVHTITVARNAVDTIILASAGYWQEVEPAKALLRSECYYQTAPKANASSAAAHLINYGLHCITDRLKSSSDLRMSSLKSVNNLVSLQAGDKSQFKWGSRQPVRRRRGDVHRDLTVVAIRLHWDGRQGSFEGDSKKTRQSLQHSGIHSGKQNSHWNLVRLHFREFPRRLKQASMVGSGPAGAKTDFKQRVET